MAQVPRLGTVPAGNAENAGSPSSTGRVPGTAARTPDIGMFSGSVVSEKAVAGEIQLTLIDALQRGLRTNLGLLVSGYQDEQARAAQLRQLSDLLPKLSAQSSYSVNQINLAAFGFTPPAGQGPVVGPFGVFDARGTLTGNLLDLSALNNLRAARENRQAAKMSYQDARELVVLVVGNSYLLTVADAARVESARAQFNTAETVYRRTVDQKNAGIVAGIDVLRSQVEMQNEQQRLLSAQNEYEKQKLALGRVIGLPPGQAFSPADTVPYAPAPPANIDELLPLALKQRADYLGAEARLRAAEAAKRASQAEALPTITVSGDYGVLGQTVPSGKTTYSLGAGVHVPIFQGGKVRADVLLSETERKQRAAELDDLRSRIEVDLRSALLDVNSAASRVEVARQTVQLAAQQLQQAQDRYAAGVAGSLDVVQAQEAVATANETYISSLYAHNVAKLLLAKAAGSAEKQTKAFLMGSNQ
jgi:outer membrane protein TolC